MSGMDLTPTIERLRGAIRDVPDFPKPGIVFKDITTLTNDPSLFRSALDLLGLLCVDLEPTRVIGIESRGFVWGGALADRLRLGFVPVRKPGKLPWRTLSASYELEYGSDTLEMHEDALKPGDSVLVVDDLIATGGTAKAVGELVARVGARVAAFVFLVELDFLGGREKLGGAEVRSLIRF
jgi:adenine phosphoribosyltransferase